MKKDCLKLECRIIMGIMLLCASNGVAQTAEIPVAKYRADRILIKPTSSDISAVHAQLGTKVYRQYPLFGNIQVISVPPQLTVQEAIAGYQKSGLVHYAEPDYEGTAVAVPNDPLFPDQWSYIVLGLPAHGSLLYNQFLFAN